MYQGHNSGIFFPARSLMRKRSLLLTPMMAWAMMSAPQRGVATADVAQLKEQKLSPLRTVALSALVAAGVLFTTVIVILAALFSGSL